MVFEIPLRSLSNLPVKLKIKPNILILGVSCFDGMASSTRVRNLLEPLINKGYINPSNLIYEKDARELKVKEGVRNNINYQVIGFRRSNPLSVFSYIWYGMRFLKKNKSKSQKNILYHYDSPNLKNIFFLFYAKLIGYKIILDIIEDNRFYSKFPRFITNLNNKSSIFFVKYSRFFTNGILTISDHLYKEMTKITKGNVPISLVPITVDLRKFKKGPYPIPENFKIFYGGSFREKDGLQYLIKSFEKISLQFKNVTLVLTGRGNAEDMKPILQLLENSPVKEKIKFKGYVSIDEYYELINECDIFCMTRINSKFANAGFPFKLGEFLATGKAVIATSVGDVGKYIQNGKNGLLINPSSVEELVSSLLFILNNPALINTLGKEGRKTAEYYFDSGKVSMQLFSFFEKL